MVCSHEAARIQQVLRTIGVLRPAHACFKLDSQEIADIPENAVLDHALQFAAGVANMDHACPAAPGDPLARHAPDKEMSSRLATPRFLRPFESFQWKSTKSAQSIRVSILRSNISVLYLLSVSRVALSSLRPLGEFALFPDRDASFEILRPNLRDDWYHDLTVIGKPCLLSAHYCRKLFYLLCLAFGCRGRKGIFVPGPRYPRRDTLAWVSSLPRRRLPRAFPYSRP